MTTLAYFLLGSNLGDRVRLLQVSQVRIEVLIGRIVAISSFYETAPWGKTDQPAFINQALAVETNLPPALIMETLKAIEKSLGRVKDEKWGPRPIDIDILFCGSQIVNDPELTIPHPALPGRRFALVPLNEIAAEFVHPVLKKTVGELLGECKDRLEVRVLAPGSGG